MIVETPTGRVSFARSGDGPDLILLHSLLSDRNVFDPVMPALTSRWRVNTVDLPGFGASSAVGPAIDAYADAIGGLLDAGHYDPDTTALLGNGLGGFVALGTAIRHGARFDRLALVGCGATFPDSARAAFITMIEKVEEGGMDAVTDIAIRRIYTEEYLASHPAAAKERVDVLRRTDPAAFITACRALHDLDYRVAVTGIRNPTLIVVGSDDRATPPDLARDLRDGIPGARYAELPGVAHAPQLQAPDDFLAVVGPFLGLTS